MKNRYWVKFCSLVVLSCVLLVSFAASAEQSAPSVITETELVADPDGYKIGTADVLEIHIWKEPDLSRDVTVRLDGRITFPLLDDIQAAGLTTLQLKHIIQSRLEEFVEGPFVTITLKDSGSQKFYILGEVAKTGEYTLVKYMTVLQAFALAGGFTEWASKKEIILLREDSGTQKIIRINFKDIVRGENFGMNVPIQANDTIIVP